MRTVSSLAALTLIVGALCPSLAFAKGEPKKADKVDEPSKASESPKAHPKHAAKSVKPKGEGSKHSEPKVAEKKVDKASSKKSNDKGDKEGVVLASASVKVDAKKATIVLASAKTPAHASKVDRHADAKSRAKGGSHAEQHVLHQVRDTLGRHHADTHGEPSKQELEKIAADAHRVEEQKLLSKVRFNKENGVDLSLKKVSTKAEKAEPVKGGKKVPTCSKPAVDFVRGDHTESIRLVTCEGNVLPEAVKSLTELAKPPSGMMPAGAEHKHIEPRLIGRLETIAEHFGKSRSVKGAGKSTKVMNEPARIEIVSGYRPYSKGSYHAHARAVDIRVKGVSNEELLAFCKTLEDTGCGYYPNSTFVHVDARDAGAGHVSWIDASGPGETPRYVSSWPPPADADDVKTSAPALPVPETENKADAPKVEPTNVPASDKVEKNDKVEKTEKTDS